MSLPAPRTLLVAIVLAACGTAPIPTQSPTASLSPSIPPQTPLDTPTPRPPPTPGYVPPSVATILLVDGLARVVVERLRQVVDPDNPTAHPRQNRGLNVLVSGRVVLLTDGPRSVRGRDYWQVFDDSLGRTVDLDDPGRPLGWVPALRDGVATLTPYQPECPPALPTTAAEVQQLQGLRDFAGYACFGKREIVLTGHVRCYEGHGDGVLAAPFFDGRRTCELDGVYVNGEPVFDLLPASGPPREIEGSYEVRGQFDHPDSLRCTWKPLAAPPGPSGTPDPGAVATCRQLFVVTAVEEL